MKFWQRKPSASDGPHARAKDLLAEKVRSGTRKPSTNYWAWGQYLDQGPDTANVDLSSQFGIFGTSAAIQVLAMKSVHDYAIAIGLGLKTLPMAFSNVDDETVRDVHAGFEERGDLLTTFKVAAILDALTTVEKFSATPTISVDWHEVSKALCDLSREDGGWPDHHDPSDDRPPTYHATAVALFSLSCCRTLSNDLLLKCQQGLTWLSDRILEGDIDIGRLSIATLCMISVAIDSFERTHSRQLRLLGVDAIKNLFSASNRAITDWISTTKPGEIRRSLEGTEYWRSAGISSPESGGTSDSQGRLSDRFDVLFYLPHCLVAWACMNVNDLRGTYRNRAFVREVVTLLNGDIRSGRTFIPAGRSRTSTVEIMWVCRLLHSYETLKLNATKAQEFVDRMRRRLHLKGSILIVFAFCSAVTLLVFGGFGNVVGAIILAGLAAYLFEIIRKPGL